MAGGGPGKRDIYVTRQHRHCSGLALPSSLLFSFSLSLPCGQGFLILALLSKFWTTSLFTGTREKCPGQNAMFIYQCPWLLPKDARGSANAAPPQERVHQAQGATHASGAHIHANYKSSETAREVRGTGCLVRQRNYLGCMETCGGPV